MLPLRSIILVSILRQIVAGSVTHTLPRDRTNIGTASHRTKMITTLILDFPGNAKVAGLTADLHLTGLQYNLCAAIFFVRDADIQVHFAL